MPEDQTGSPNRPYGFAARSRSASAQEPAAPSCALLIKTGLGRPRSIDESEAVNQSSTPSVEPRTFIAAARASTHPRGALRRRTAGPRHGNRRCAAAQLDADVRCRSSAPVAALRRPAPGSAVLRRSRATARLQRAAAGRWRSRAARRRPSGAAGRIDTVSHCHGRIDMPACQQAPTCCALNSALCLRRRRSRRRFFAIVFTRPPGS